MSLPIDSVITMCNEVAEHVRQYNNALTVHFIPHHDGQRRETIYMAAQEISPHPAAQTASHFLRNPRRSEESALLGMAIAREKLFWGLATRHYFLSLCTINIDDFEDINVARMQAWHLAWHALNFLDYHKSPENQSDKNRDIIVRKRNLLELARANLEADIFSSFMNVYYRDRDSIDKLGKLRSLSALSVKTLKTPEYFPFSIAVEAAEELLSKSKITNTSPKHVIDQTLKMARRVALSLTEQHLKTWFGFSDPAQDMAWRGFEKADILSAAINTSPNHHIRSMGFMISELCAIDPAPAQNVQDIYSPFADSQFNTRLHEKMIESVKKDVITQSLLQNSSAPFIQMAHDQNRSLTEGTALGWCANALQAAAATFENALRRNETPEIIEHKTIEKFTSAKQDVDWDDIEKLGKRIIKKQRAGDNVTMADIKDIVEDIESLQALKSSIENTLAAPSYQQSLDAAAELNSTQNLQPSGPAPSAAPQAGPKAAAPAMAMTPSAPGMGMGGGGGIVKPPAQPQKETQKETQKADRPIKKETKTGEET